MINGHKWFTTNGMVADLLIVMATTDAGAEPHERASMFLVPGDAPGVRKVRNVPVLGGEEHWGFGHAELYYDDVRVPRESIIGAPGDGFRIAQARLGPGRIHHCMRWLGQSRRAFDIMCERALQRQVGGDSLASRQTVQNWIADSAARLMTSMPLGRRCSAELPRHGRRSR